MVKNAISLCASRAVKPRSHWVLEGSCTSIHPTVQPGGVVDLALLVGVVILASPVSVVVLTPPVGW